MSKTPKMYSIAQVRDHLSEIVHQAEAGEEITLTRRGRPVAVLLSRREFERLRGETPNFWTLYQRLREDVGLDQVTIERDTFADLRDKTVGRDVSL